MITFILSLSPIMDPKLRAARLHFLHSLQRTPLPHLRTRLKALLNVYLAHRPLMERLLTAGFVVYCLASTYLGVTGKGGPKGGDGARGDRKGRKGESSH